MLVVPGFHPDPSVCRVGDDYYLVCSSFEYFPGVPVFHSRDLRRWRQIGNALDRPSQLPLPPETSSSGGIYAPTIRYHDERFWIITTNTSYGGTFLVSATSPDGPWSEPVWIDLPGIDPDLAWDEDGTCWCAVSGTQVARIDPVTGRVLDGPFPAWAGTGLQYPEAPHLYRIGDWWYLMIAEGGTERGHTVAMARARSPLGPYEAAPHNPIVTHRSTDRPVQSTGHADLVTAPDGKWWMVLLGTRPRGKTPAFHVLGRETFLAPVEWIDGWPRVGAIDDGTPAGVDPLAGVARDDFDSPSLAPEWISPRWRTDISWSLTDRPGWLTLHATGPTLDRPGHTFVGRRQQHHDVRVTARLDPGSARAGLSVRLDEAHHYDLEVADGRAEVIARIGPLRQVVGSAQVANGPVDLTIEIRTTDLLPPNVTGPAELADGPVGVDATGPDTLAFRIGGGPALAELDGRYLSTEVATGFTGRVIGMYVTSGTAAFDWYAASPLPDPSGDAA